MLTQFTNNALSASNHDLNGLSNESHETSRPFEEESLEAEGVQEKLDAMRRENEHKAQNFIPGLVHYMNPETKKPQRKHSITIDIDLDAVENTIKKGIKGVIAFRFLRTSPEVKSHNFHDILTNPTQSKTHTLKHFTQEYKELLTPDSIRDFLLTAIKLGCKGSGERTNEMQERYDIASHLIPLFYNDISEVSRIALFHYAVTSNSRDIFNVLARAHRSQASSDSFIDSLIDKISEDPELYDKFKEELSPETSEDSFLSSFYKMFEKLMNKQPEPPKPAFVSLDESTFNSQITPCFAFARSQDPAEQKTLEDCMKTAKKNGYQIRNSIFS